MSVACRPRPWHVGSCEAVHPGDSDLYAFCLDRGISSRALSLVVVRDEVKSFDV
jgi:hypothetical protein